jgi:hypothetical protein
MRTEKLRIYHREYMRKYRKEPKFMAYHRKWMREWHRKNATAIYARRRQRPYEKLAATIRSRVRSVLKLGYKSANTETLLGCSVKELQTYIELRFLPEMTWQNYGFYGWHIDHIKPLSSFDLNNPEEQQKAFHYTNLQPLWAKDNLQKHAKVL